MQLPCDKNKPYVKKSFDLFLLYLDNRYFLFLEVLYERNYFRPVSIVKFLRTAFLQTTSRSSRLQMFFKIDTLKSFGNFTGKHLSWSLFLKNLQAESLQLDKKTPPTQVFSVKFAKFLKTPFYRTPPVAASLSPVAASVFFLKK